MRDFKDLKVWQRSHRLVLAVYRATACFPTEERFGLTSQLRRASASIPANISEGAGRGTDTDFRRFLRYAMGSANEVEYHLILARDLGLLEGLEVRRIEDHLYRVRQMLDALVLTLGSGPRRGGDQDGSASRPSSEKLPAPSPQRRA